MKAILQTSYCTPDLLRYADVERPAVTPDGVLVRVVAVSLHKGDWHLLTGTPYLLRIAGFGLFKPKRTIPGMAVSGEVAAVGAGVTTFAVGDAVFGEIEGGGFAEYVCVRADQLVRKPANVSFEDIATLPISATTALQGLRDAGRLQRGQSVLVNGAAGGVGTFAVQIAKALGAEVTGVCSTGNVALVRSLGADAVIDYTRDDFTLGERRYDLILDLVGNRSVADCRRALNPQGRVVAVAGGAEHGWTGPLFPILWGLATNLFSRKVFAPLAAVPRQEDLLTVAQLAESGQVRPVIERRYPLREVPEALRALGLGRSRGKAVIDVQGSADAQKA